MRKRIVTKIGDIFCVEFDGKRIIIYIIIADVVIRNKVLTYRDILCI